MYRGQDGTSKRSAVPGRAYVIVALLFVFQTLNFFDKLAFGVAGVPMMRELGLTPAAFGLVGSIFFFFFFVGGIIVGLCFVGRYPSKTILLSLAAIWTISQFPIVFTSSVPVIIACRMLLGLGEGAALATAMTAAYEWFPQERRYIPSAVILQGISAGFLIGGPLLTYFAVHHGWRSSFLVCGLLSLVWLLLYSLVGKAGPFAASQVSHVSQVPPLPASVLWLDRTVIGVLLLLSFSYWVIGMAAVWLPPFLRLGLGYGDTTSGWVISAIYLIQSPLLLAGSWVTQSLHKKGMSGRLCLGLSSVFIMLVSGIALISAVLLHTGPIQIALLAVAFSSPSLTTIFAPVILASIAPPSQRSKLVVTIISASSITAIFSTYGNGWVVGQFPHDPPTGFAVAFAIGGGVLILGAISSFFLLHPDRTLARFNQIRSNSQSEQKSANDGEIGLIVGDPMPARTLQ